MSDPGAGPSPQDPSITEDEEALADFERLAHDWLWETGPDGTFTRGVERMVDLLGTAVVPSGHLTWRDLVVPGTDLAFLAGESFDQVVVEVGIRGQVRHLALRGRAFGGPDGRHVRGAATDVTDLVVARREVARTSSRDGVTGMLTRHGLIEAFEARLPHGIGAGMGVVVVDVSQRGADAGFGSSHGDRVLSVVAERLAGAHRSAEWLCGRVGADRFVVVATGPASPDGGAIEEVATAIGHLASLPVEVGPARVRLHPVVGWAVAPPGSRVETVIEEAIEALEHAHRTGRAIVGCTPAVRAEAHLRRRLLNDVDRGLVRRQFPVHYQPIVDARDRCVVAFEALVRWGRADAELTAPEAFITGVEASSLVVPLGTWVLQQACAAAATWPSAIGVHVNVAAAQLAAPDFASCVEEVLGRSGLSPDRLTLEVVERTMVDERVVVARKLERLRAAGVRCVLDDFLVGYCSLGLLEDLPVDGVKVDRSFTRSLNAGEPSAPAAAVAELAGALGLSCVAEGIETPHGQDAAVALGCGGLQGYLYSPPVPAEQVAGLLDGVPLGLERGR